MMRATPWFLQTPQRVLPSGKTSWNGREPRYRARFRWYWTLAPPEKDSSWTCAVRSSIQLATWTSWWMAAGTCCMPEAGPSLWPWSILITRSRQSALWNWTIPPSAPPPPTAGPGATGCTMYWTESRGNPSKPQWPPGPWPRARWWQMPWPRHSSWWNRPPLRLNSIFPGYGCFRMGLPHFRLVLRGDCSHECHEVAIGHLVGPLHHVPLDFVGSRGAGGLQPAPERLGVADVRPATDAGPLMRVPGAYLWIETP